MEIPLVGAKLFHAKGGRTDGRNLMNAPKNRMFTYVKIQFLLSREHSDFPLERPYRSFSITAGNVENV